MTNHTLMRLRFSWFKILSLFVLVLGGSWWFLTTLLSSNLAARWLFLATGMAIYLMVHLWLSLALNRLPLEGEILPDLGIGNMLTISRGIFLTIVAGFILLPRLTGTLGYVPGVAFSVAIVADFFDGYLARRLNQVTLLGEALDLHLDGLGVLIGSSLAVHYQQAPLWFLLVGMARYLFIMGQWLLAHLGRPFLPLDDRPGRRPIAGVTMGFIAILLFPFFSPPATHLAAIFFALPFLAGFTRDFLVSSGKMPARSNTDSTTHSVLVGKLISCSSFILRLLTTFLLAYWLIERAIPGSIHSEASPLWKGVIIIFSSSGLLLLALGAAGRIAAVFLLCAVGLFQEIQGLTLMEAILIAAGSALLFIGSGPYSLWTPENAIIEKRLGEV